jgi:uncharacterized radical SAM superfamily Fe-S cluster-containing enzyme
MRHLEASAVLDSSGHESRTKLLFALSDLVRCTEEQTGISGKEVWHALGFAQPVSKITSAVRIRSTSPVIRIACWASYLFTEQSAGRAIPMEAYRQFRRLHGAAGPAG